MGNLHPGLKLVILACFLVDRRVKALQRLNYDQLYETVKINKIHGNVTSLTNS
jgi:hypothetical protein